VSEVRAARFIAGYPIRAIAAFGVFFLHVNTIAVGAAHWGQAVTLNQSRQAFGPVLGELVPSIGNGVPNIFALSGYLIVRPFARAFVDGAPPPGILRYLRHRAFRILPAFWVVLSAVILIWGVNGASLRRVAAMYVFNVNWPTAFFGSSHRLGPAWSMNVEVRFYLAVALLAIALVLLRRPLRHRRWARASLLVAASVATGVASLLAFGHTTPADALSLPTQQLYAFVPGLVLASIEPLIPARLPHARLLRLLGAVIAAAGISALCAYDSLLPKLTSLLAVSPNVAWRLYLALMSSAIIGGPLLYQWAGGGCWRILDNRLLRWLGTRSYAFYLIHFAVLIYLAEKLHGIGSFEVELLAIAPAGFALTSLLSELSYRVVELPCQRLARRIDRSRVTAAPEPAPALEFTPAAAEQTAPLTRT
jgi:peptidoglycan/LPS O-acetylase OafA/YrhL